MATNRYNVPQKQWRKWSSDARSVFNRVFEFIRNNQWAMLHPKQPKVTKEHWDTTAWNAAWISADAVDDTVPHKVI